MEGKNVKKKDIARGMRPTQSSLHRSPSISEILQKRFLLAEGSVRHHCGWKTA